METSSLDRVTSAGENSSGAAPGAPGGANTQLKSMLRGSELAGQIQMLTPRGARVPTTVQRKVEGAAKWVQRTPDPEQQRQIDAEINRAQRRITGVGGMFDRRINAVNQLITDLAPSTENPNPGLDIIKAAAQAALGIATGGIGGIIAGRIASAVVDGAAKAVEDHIKSVISSTLSTAITSGIGAAYAAAGTTAPARGAFLRSQQQALSDTAQRAGDALEERRTTFYSGADGLAQARALAAAYDAEMQVAWDRQYGASLAEWATLVNNSQRLTDRSPGSMDTTAEGILGIDVDLPNPGAELRITGAHLDGIPAEARNNFKTQAGSMTIGDLTPASGGMTVRVIQQGHSPGLFGSSASTRVRVAMESRPGARNQVLGMLTGSEGMFVIDRVRQRFSNPEFASTGASGGANYDYNLVPVGGQIIWAREIMGLRMNQLPNLAG